ncbi:MAG TPA: protein-glutamate O-methyltransferase CheR [Halanaerobiales bacterium]|nr:protein-glutamate O-methyltransferase CheR [Halanaerobiales bacterium]
MSEFQAFKKQASEILNLDLSGYKEKRIERRTKSLMKRYDIDNFKECSTRLEKDLQFREAYLNHFTINTSEFFRNPKNYDYLEEKILPELLENNSKINIWSAPCSNGAEPYTIAIILNEMGVRSSQFHILGSDLDPEILSAAKKGLYTLSNVKNVPDKIFDKYFKSLDGQFKRFQLSSEIKNMVKFEKKDLINGKFRKDDWDLIVSRNFFIYLTKEYKNLMIDKFTDVLKENRYFFIGSTEFIFGSEKFDLKKENLSFYKKILK